MFTIIRSFNKYTQRSFSVLNHYDLNLNSELRLGNEAEGQKTVCCWPCKSDPITGKLKTTKTGYVPGEFIKFEASLHNQYLKPIKICAVKLTQNMRFYAQGSTKFGNRDLELVYCPQLIGAGDFYEWSGSIQIPPVCSNLTRETSVCSNIEVWYTLALYFDAGTFSFRTMIAVPIVIGTVPMQSETGIQTEACLPSYASCMYASTVDSDGWVFRPIYPYFKLD